MSLGYIVFKLKKKMQGVAKKNSKVSKDAKLEAGTVFVNSSIGRFSYCGYDCYICNTTIGAFCSISDNVSVGGGHHPLDWVSTSPAFYKGRDSISKRLASLVYDMTDPVTTIGNDVWIGRGCYLKAGITIGDGAVIGMGSIVTKDVEPYTIVAGNPAVIIKKRYGDTDTLRNSMQSLAWWEWDERKLKDKAYLFDNPVLLMEEWNV